MTFANLGSQGQHGNGNTETTDHTQDKGSCSPSDRRCVAAGSPSPCWWSRRCRARWSGPPSRTGWGSLGEERGGQSRGENGINISPVEVVGNPGGRIPIIFLCAARGSSSGLEPCWERFGSEPNLRVLGSRGQSKGGLISGILGRGWVRPANTVSREIWGIKREVWRDWDYGWNNLKTFQTSSGLNNLLRPHLMEWMGPDCSNENDFDQNLPKFYFRIWLQDWRYFFLHAMNKKYGWIVKINGLWKTF